MVLQHCRTQHPVGQGFFHTAEVWDEERRLSYVFDCGSMTSYKKPRSKRISGYRTEMGPDAFLDLLFISHSHADHLNGLEELLAPGVKVDTIVLPMMNAVDRLYTFARDLKEDPLSSRSAFYQDFVADPGSALGRFQPRQILFVQPRHDGGGAPGGDDGPLRTPDGGENIGQTPTAARCGWKLIGRGYVRVAPVGQRAQNAALTAVIEDVQAIAVHTGAGMWLLSPYVDPTVDADRNKFLSALRSELSASGEKRLARAVNKLTASDLRLIVTDHVAALAAAYESVVKNLNVTSLSLYSGPLPVHPARKADYVAMLGRWTATNSDSEKVAWLTTGDAALKEAKRRKPFLKHFAKLLESVRTVTLPHHGSDHNFDPELLVAIQADFFVVSADHYGTWRHPGSKVVQAVASTGGSVSAVTSSELSRFQEFVTLK